jgi:hypothetical protein
MDLAALEALVGLPIPIGAYRIDPGDHARAMAAFHNADYGYDSAHPVYAHLAPHCGMGWKLEELFEVVDADLDSGVLFGQADLTYFRPIEIDVEYEVRGHVAAVERKEGRRAGIFDLITLHLELVDPDGEPTVLSLETYVFPRAGMAMP